MSRADGLASAEPFRISPIRAGLGARIEGLDLSAPLDETTFEAIRRAFFEHHILAIPGQDISAADLVRFSKRFGELEPHLLDQFHHPDFPEILMLSTVVEDGRPLGFATPPDPAFHSDLSYRPLPSRVTLLYALEVPTDGSGDTRFIDTVAAYEALPAEIQRSIGHLRAVHNYAYRYGDRLTPEQLARTEDVVHPVVRRIPETGQRSLFVNPSFTGRIEDLPERASQNLLSQLFEHCEQERFGLTYAWTAGDLVFWDNAATMHAATALPEGARRTLMRTTVIGEVPI
ncbi:MAG: TauD/TfdA family dioxygenase [Caldilineae bacterium]|nr:TauD/TfdA family dioxygenase [Chloroflexota bacterium]MCB9175909.1 TauD/TfdA family dioxygenase [Caldilineae bacterium]